MEQRVQHYEISVCRTGRHGGKKLPVHWFRIVLPAGEGEEGAKLVRNLLLQGVGDGVAGVEATVELHTTVVTKPLGKPMTDDVYIDLEDANHRWTIYDGVYSEKYVLTNVEHINVEKKEVILWRGFSRGVVRVKCERIDVCWQDHTILIVRS